MTTSLRLHSNLKILPLEHTTTELAAQTTSIARRATGRRCTIVIRKGLATRGANLTGSATGFGVTTRENNSPAMAVTKTPQYTFSHVLRPLLSSENWRRSHGNRKVRVTALQHRKCSSIPPS